MINVCIKARLYVALAPPPRHQHPRYFHFVYVYVSLDSKPLRKAAWYTLFTHAPELPRIWVIVNCSIFISILITH